MDWQQLPLNGCEQRGWEILSNKEPRRLHNRPDAGPDPRNRRASFLGTCIQTIPVPKAALRNVAARFSWQISSAIIILLEIAMSAESWMENCSSLTPRLRRLLSNSGSVLVPLSQDWIHIATLLRSNLHFERRGGLPYFQPHQYSFSCLQCRQVTLCCSFPLIVS